MGKTSCWLWTDSASSFFLSPEFLYFYLLVLVLLAANLVCFVITGARLGRVNTSF